MCANNDDRLVCDMCAWHATIITLLPNNNNNDGFASSFLLQHRPKFCLLQPDFTLFQEATLVFLSCEKLHATYFGEILFSLLKGFCLIMYSLYYLFFLILEPFSDEFYFFRMAFEIIRM